MAIANIQKANYAKEQLKMNGVEVVFEGPSFNEFVVRLNKPIKEINEYLLTKGIIGGFDLEKFDPSLKGHMLIAVTELRTKEEIDTFVKELGDQNAK